MPVPITRQPSVLPDMKAYLRESAARQLDVLKQMNLQGSPRRLNQAEMPSTTPSQAPANDQGSISPLESKFGVTQNFGNYNPGLYAGKTPGALHQGLDIGTPEGTAVRSPFAGLVKTGEDKDFGKFVEIRTQDGQLMRFSHLKNIDDLILKLGEAGQQIQAGQQLGLTGKTGYATGPHLDIMYQQGGKWVNPLNYAPLKQTLG